VGFLAVQATLLKQLHAQAVEMRRWSLPCVRIRKKASEFGQRQFQYQLDPYYMPHGHKDIAFTTMW
jgi:hypothetical protein